MASGTLCLNRSIRVGSKPKQKRFLFSEKKKKKGGFAKKKLSTPPDEIRLWRAKLETRRFGGKSAEKVEQLGD